MSKYVNTKGVQEMLCIPQLLKEELSKNYEPSINYGDVIIGMC